MTYNQAQIRIGVYSVTGWALKIGTGLILFTAVAKGFVAFNRTQGCGFFLPLCNSLVNEIISLVNSYFYPTRIWFWLPDTPPQFWYLSLISSVGLCAAFFMLFSFFLDRARRNLSTALMPHQQGHALKGSINNLIRNLSGEYMQEET